ncbi:MAG: hypothetical protein J6A06_04100 [Fibrobacteraceae bacterium]|nr:hypothetical protein [Fibrobacteraceae bacterium]
MSVFLLHAFTFANDFQTLSEKSSKNIQLTEIDSAEIYQNLIAEENLDANYTQNVVGIVFGSVFTGTGTFLLSFGVYGFFYKYSKPESFSDIGGSALSLISTFFSIPMLSIGIPLLVHNINKYSSRKNHAEKRNEYIRAYKRYKKQKEETSLQIMLLPSINFAHNAAGLSAVVAF